MITDRQRMFESWGLLYERCTKEKVPTAHAVEAGGSWVIYSGGEADTAISEVFRTTPEAWQDAAARAHGDTSPRHSLYLYADRL
jgi:hypothetical protein